MSPAYVPDPMELDEHVPVYVPEPEHPEYRAPSDDNIQEDTDEDSIDYPDEPKDGKEDDNEDPEEDPSEEHEPEDDDDDDEDEELTEDEEDEEHPAPAESFAVLIVDLVPSGRDTEAFKTDESAPTSRSPQTRVPFSQTRLSESSAAAARAPRHQYDFVDTIEVRRKESEDFYTQLHDARTDRRDISLEIDVVRGQRTAYETELHEVRQAYLSSEARNRALLARLETHVSHMEWQRQRAEDDAVRQIISTQVLEARAQIDMVEDAGRSC
ncbi:hypothetical protein Tco_1487709 [Tanacetum coccineum]